MKDNFYGDILDTFDCDLSDSFILQELLELDDSFAAEFFWEKVIESVDEILDKYKKENIMRL